MNVISRRKLLELSGRRAGGAANDLFLEWFRIAHRADWATFADVRRTFGRADVATDTASGRTATVFDVGGNRHRIISLIDYRRRTLLITHVLTHKEYDRQQWKKEL